MPGILLILRSKHTQVVGNANFCVGVAHGLAFFMENIVRLDVAVAKIFHDTKGICQGCFCRGPLTKKVGIGGIHIGLINGNIIADQITKAFGSQFYQFQIIMEVFPLGKGAHIFKPHGIGEMVDGHEGSNSLFLQSQNLPAIALHRFFIDFTGRRH